MAEIVSENNDIGSINFVNGLSDPGEMIACGYLPQLRRNEGEQDREYAERIRPLVMALPAEDREKIMGAALRRANLDGTNGKVAVMVAGEPAWHGLGVNVKEAVTSAEALKLAGLDWKVEIWHSQAVDDGRIMVAPECRHVVRVDAYEVLGTVGTRYQPFQNAEAFDFLDGLVGERLAMFETAGAINSGKTVWMQCRIPNRYYVTPKDEIEPFVLLCNSHDGSSALSIMPTTLRAVCQNTLRLSMKNGGAEKALRIRHSASLKGKVEKAKEHLGLVSQRLEKFSHQAQALVAVSLKETQVTEYLDQFFPTRIRPSPPVRLIAEAGKDVLDHMIDAHGDRTEVMRDLLDAHYAESERQAKRNAGILDVVLANYHSDPAEGTAWGAFNAITEYADHGMSFRGKTPEAKANSRLQSAWFGAGDELKQEAFEAALQLAK